LRSLSFGKTIACCFPKLFAVANRVLCIPATSAASERLYSVAGRMLEMRRTRFAGWVSFGQNWKTGTRRQHFAKNDRSIFNHCDVIGQQGCCVFEPPLGKGQRTTFILGSLKSAFYRRTDRQTDGQTDGQTDTFLIASPCWHSMQLERKSKCLRKK